MEKRNQQRYPIHIEGHITTSEGSGKPCIIRDFNANGMFISCESETFQLLPREDLQLNTGDTVEVVFKMPRQNARVRVRATVKRVERSPFEDGLGLFYAKCNPTILKALLQEAKRGD